MSPATYAKLTHLYHEIALVKLDRQGLDKQKSNPKSCRGKRRDKQHKQEKTQILYTNTSNQSSDFKAQKRTNLRSAKFRRQNPKPVYKVRYINLVQTYTFSLFFYYRFYCLKMPTAGEARLAFAKRARCQQQQPSVQEGMRSQSLCSHPQNFRAFWQEGHC